MLAELNFLILHSCDIAQVQNPLYDHTYALLLYFAILFIFYENYEQVLSMKPMVIILMLCVNSITIYDFLN